MLNHYKDLVDEMCVVVYEWVGMDTFDEVQNIVSQFSNAKITNRAFGDKYNWEFVTQLYNEEKSKYPNDWWVISDDDEDAKLQKEQDKQKAERRQHEKEAERINKERYNQWRKQQEEESEKERTKREEEEINNPEHIVITRLRVEFNLLLSKGCSTKKSKHKLLLKYHPDKNRENDKWANMMTQNILKLF